MRAHAYGRQEKRIATAVAALIAAGVAAAATTTSTVVSANQSEKARKLQEQKMWQSKAGELAELKRKENENYLDTAAGQNVVRQAKEIADRATKQARGAQAMGGGTDAAVALSKEQANKQVSDAMAQIAGNDTVRKDAASDQRREVLRTYGAQEAELEAQRANNISQVASGVANGISSTANAFASGMATKSSVGKTGNVSNVGNTFDNQLITDPNQNYYG